LVKLSPELLEWLTKNKPKTGENRKLRFQRIEGELYFSETDLKEFDGYLREPWPKGNGSRPNLPAGIRREIESEAGYMCAICGTATREAAHIDPVHATRNNHPHNLICLCPTHHTQTHEGVIKKQEISATKKRLINARVTLWNLQAKGFDFALKAIAEIGEMEKLPSEISKLLSATSLEELGRAASAVPKNDFVREVTEAIKNETPIRALAIARRRELQRTGEANCPLCEGSGTHNNWECPVCRGAGTVSAEALPIDLTPYVQERCTLCEGSGTHNNWECPVCRGEGTVDAQHAPEIDLRPFKQCRCKICDGSGTRRGYDCPVCRGTGTVNAQDALEIEEEKSLFEQEGCPLCSGSRQHRGKECPVCQGYGTIDKKDVDEFNPNDFASVSCSNCDGEGEIEGEPCRQCEGDGTVDAYTLY